MQRLHELDSENQQSIERMDHPHAAWFKFQFVNGINTKNDDRVHKKTANMSLHVLILWSQALLLCSQQKDEIYLSTPINETHLMVKIKAKQRQTFLQMKGYETPPCEYNSQVNLPQRVCW